MNKGIYDIEPLQSDIPDEETVPEQNTAAEDADRNIADEYLSSAQRVEEEDDVAPAEKQPFVPVQNPLKIAIDNGQVDLSDFYEDEEDYPEKPKKTSVIVEKLKSIDRGESGYVFVSSVVSCAVFLLWFVLYLVCVISREFMLAAAQKQMLLAGTTDYTVEITSPLFIVLKIMIFALPFIMIAWIIGIGVANKRGKSLCDNRLIVASYILDAVVGFVALIDAFAIRIVFG